MRFGKIARPSGTSEIPSATRFSVASPASERPASFKAPLASGKSPMIVFSVVVLPAPFAPIIATISPGKTRRLMPRSALMPP